MPRQVCRSSKDVDSTKDEQHFLLVTQLAVMLDVSMPVFFSRPSLFQAFVPSLSQMHGVFFSVSVVHVGIYSKSVVSTCK